MSLEMFSAVFSVIAVIGSPIAFAVFQKKGNHSKFGFWNVIAGIVSTFLFKYVLFGFLSSWAVRLLGLDVSSAVTACLVSVICTAAMIMLALAVAEFIYCGRHMDKDQAVGFALGATITDIMNSFLMAALSNLVYLEQTSAGTFYTNLLETLTEEQALAVMDTYAAYTPAVFIYPGVITLAFLAGNYLSAVLFAGRTERHSFSYVFLAVLCTATYSAIFYWMAPDTIANADLFLVITALLLFMTAQFIYKHYTVHHG
ncbi:MAG: hypothetical protein IJ225_00975 [Solobacterium sp.]|nr:hypothetical protein [Solobacterium sp.]